MIKKDLYDLYEIKCDKYEKYYKFLDSRSIEYNEREILPENLLHEYENYLLSLEESLQEKDKLFYRDIYESQNNFLRSLKELCIDKKLLKYYISIEKSESIKDTLYSFFCKYDNFTEKVVYNRTSTKTGRLTVKSGPKVLTLPKRYRNIITSRFGEEGHIVELDFNSVEPRIFKKILGEEVPDDIYEHLQNKIDVPVDRSVIKKTIISVLYGASNLSSDNNISFTTWEKVNNAVLDFFDLEKMYEIANKRVGEFRVNYYGRPIKNDLDSKNIVLNNIVQSTAADFFLIAFKTILDKIENEFCVPLFVLHDALVLDVHISQLKNVQNIKSTGYDDIKLGHFPLDINIFNEEQK